MELLATYSLGEIVTFIVLLAGALVSFLKFCSFINGYISTFLTGYVKKHEDRESQSEVIAELLRMTTNISQKIEDLDGQVQILKDSDKDDIKSYITDKHHQCVYYQGWIDHHTAESIEARYQHYVAEGGNSFVANLMEDIRSLPKQPPHKDRRRKKIWGFRKKNGTD